MNRLNFAKNSLKTQLNSHELFLLLCIEPTTFTREIFSLLLQLNPWGRQPSMSFLPLLIERRALGRARKVHCFTLAFSRMRMRAGFPRHSRRIPCQCHAACVGRFNKHTKCNTTRPSACVARNVVEFISFIHCYSFIACDQRSLPFGKPMRFIPFFPSSIRTHYRRKRQQSFAAWLPVRCVPCWPL